MSESLTTFIPAGGLGSRLLPHTLEVPKPLLLMGAPYRRIIDGPLAICTEPSERIWVSTDYMADQIEEYLAGQQKITTIRDSGTLGSGGSLIEHYEQFSELESDGNLLVLPSDHIYDGDFSIEKYLAVHRQSGADMTLMTVPQKSYGEYLKVDGELALGIEKVPSAHDVSTTGTYMFRNKYILDVLQRLRRSNETSLNIYKDIVCPAVGSTTVSHFFVGAGEGFWEDTGTLKRYLRSNMRLSGNRNVIDSRAEIAEEAVLNRCVVLANAALGEEYDIKDSIVTASNDGSVHVTCVA